MLSKSKGILIIGLLLITCISTLAIVFGLSSSDVLGTNKRPLTISTVSAEKVYDGLELHEEGYEITSGELKKGHTMTVKYLNSLTDVGTVPNAIAVSIIDKEDVDVTGDYDITYNLGTLAVLTRDITVTSETITKTYDGKEFEYKKASISTGSLAEGQIISYDFTKYVQRIGETENTFTATITTENLDDVTRNYNIKYVYGDIVLSSCIIAIKTDTLSKAFDGKALSSDNYDIISGTIPAGLEIVIDYNPEITYVTKVDNEFKLRIVNSLSQEDVSEFFDLTYLNGYLEITKRPITVNVAGKEREYDGTPLSNTKVDIVSGSLPDGYGIVVVDNPSITDVGSIDNDLILEVRKLSNNENFSQYFDLIYSTGKLTVKKCEIRIETPSDERVYNGIPLSNDGYTSTTLPAGYVLSITNLPIVETIGEVENKITFKVVKDGTDDDYSQFFNINYDSIGTLKVSKLAVTISTGTTTRTYSGEDVTNTNCYVSKGSLPTNFSLVYDKDNTPSIRNVGKIDNAIDYSIMYKVDDETSIDVTEYCDITKSIGKITITAKKVTVTTPSITKFYDGKPVEQTADDLVLKIGDELATNEHFAITAPQDIEVNTNGYKNNVDIKILDADEEETTSNYELTIIIGTNIINPRPLKLKTKSYPEEGKYYYTGENIPTDNNVPFVISTGDGTLLDGDRIVVLSGTSAYKAGTTTNKCTVAIYNADDEDVTHHYDNVNGNMTYGSLVISKRVINITSLSAAKDYDGTPLTNHTYTCTSEFATNEEIVEVNFSDNATITNVGSVPNTIASVVIKNTVTNIVTTENYTINYDIGTLTINKVYGSVSSSGELSTDGGFGLPSGDIEPVDVANITTQYSGYTYLKSYNYKDISYVGGQWKWSNPVAYDTLINGMSADYLTGIALLYSGATVTNVQITDSKNYTLPYYLTDNTTGYNKQTSDVKYLGSDTDYSIWVGNINLGRLSSYTYGNSNVVEFENAYRAYVYDTYLNVNANTSTYLQTLIANNNLSQYAYSSTMSDVEYTTAIRAIIAFIKSSAVYNLDYNRDIDNTSSEPTIAFFEAGEGICQHFALAGTMLLRELGYPARFTVGFVKYSIANDETTVTSDDAHAWVEVYHDGLGWIQVEMTAGVSSEIIEIENPDAIKVRPKDCIVSYDSTLPLTWDSIYASSINSDGYIPCSEGIVINNTYTGSDYYYKATIIGSQTTVGSSNSMITSFALYKKVGDDYVLQNEEFTLQTGKLQVYYDVVTINVQGASKEYNGSPLQNISALALTGTYGESLLDIGTPYESNGNIHKYSLTLRNSDSSTTELVMVVTITGSQLGIGRSQNTCSVQIFTADESEDITNKYKIIKNMGYLNVSKIAITITADSATGTYDPDSSETLTCDTYSYSGTLLTGDSFSEVIVTGEIALNTPGTELNEITSIIIVNDKDEVVYNSVYPENSYYKIVVNPGFLTVS